MSTTSTQDNPPRNPTRRRRRRRGDGSGGGKTTQNANNRNRRNRKRSGSRQPSTRRSNANRGSGGVYRISRTGERPTPALWRRVLQVVTFGLFRADPYFVPGSERFTRPESPEAPPPKDTGKAAASRPRKRRKGDEGRQARKEGSGRTREQAEVSSGRCFVGNLSYDVGEDGLRELFSTVGSVASAELVINTRTGKSKGYGFVTMGSIDEAKAAVSRFHDHELKGRKMVVSGARSTGPKTAQETSPDN